MGEQYNIREIAFDRWGAVQMVQNLEGMGFTDVPFGQGIKDMSQIRSGRQYQAGQRKIHREDRRCSSYNNGARPCNSLWK